jgi:hypothetical protein
MSNDIEYIVINNLLGFAVTLLIAPWPGLARFGPFGSKEGDKAKLRWEGLGMCTVCIYIYTYIYLYVTIYIVYIYTFFKNAACFRAKNPNESRVDPATWPGGWNPWAHRFLGSSFR